MTAFLKAWLGMNKESVTVSGKVDFGECSIFCCCWYLQILYAESIGYFHKHSLHFRLKKR